MEQISESLYVYEDTCRVYIVKSGAEAVLIDFGDGAVLDELAKIGVKRATDVLMTHHHRDQGQGLPRAAEKGIRIWVPHAEQDLFAKMDEHWQAREIRNNYNSRQDRFSLLHSVGISGTLKDYAEFQAGAHRLLIVPTPGHTTGSISLLGDIDGKRVAFTGDLIAAPGRVWSLSATQWTYNGAEGAPSAIASLLDLSDRNPELLLPSHGEAMRDPAEAIHLLVERLWRLLQYRKTNPRLFQLREKPYENVSPHLLRSRASMSNYFVLLSESGKALFFDFGYDFLTGIPAGADRASRRPWLYNLPKLKKDYGVTKVDAVLLTHYHDDHVAGCNLLRDVEGTEVWAAESFADIIENPGRYDLPCLWYDPTPVDRVLPLERKLRWEEYEFTLYPLPGHTLYAVAIAFEADGRKVLVAGDQYQGDDGILYNYVYPNRFSRDDYVTSAELYRRLQPDVILTGHWDPLWVKPGYYEVLEERGSALEQLHRELLPQGEINFGDEGFGARITPYESDISPGVGAAWDVEVFNPCPYEAELKVKLIVPEGWWPDQPEQIVRVAAKRSTVISFTLSVPEGAAGRRIRIAADLTADGIRFGQQAEALVNIINIGGYRS